MPKMNHLKPFFYLIPQLTTNYKEPIKKNPQYIVHTTNKWVPYVEYGSLQKITKAYLNLSHVVSAGVALP